MPTTKSTTTHGAPQAQPEEPEQRPGLLSGILGAVGDGPPHPPRSEQERLADEIKREVDSLVSDYQLADKRAVRWKVEPQVLREYLDAQLRRIFKVAVGIDPQKRRRRELMLRIDRLARGVEDELDLEGMIRGAYDPAITDRHLARIVLVWSSTDRPARKRGGAKPAGLTGKWPALARLIARVWSDGTSADVLRKEWAEVAKKMAP